MSLFADQPKKDTTSVEKPQMVIEPWKVLLVDDDEQMHQVTQLALSGFSFDGRGLNLISAYSNIEAQKILEQDDDIALAIVDVVMESEHAGLELVKFIREHLNNHVIRVVLRTGQAGQAPEDVVIREYEIDDYKEKTELTTQKLRTLLYSMLRVYRGLCLIEKQKEGLRKVIISSAKVQNTTSLQTYASAVLEQMTRLLNIDDSAFYCVVRPILDWEQSRALTLAATGKYVNLYSECAFNKLPPKVSERLKETLAVGHSKLFGDAFVLYSKNEENVENLLYINFHRELSEVDIQLLEIYMQNISLTFENLGLLMDIKETSKELVYHLANAVEARSRETGAHVQRVSLISEKLAHLYGLDESDVTMIKHASPLHDVGKVAIPDAILHKPGKLTEEEWITMKKHVEYGVDILSKSQRTLLVTAKEIVASHHEKWDGSGYPNGTKGEDIPISGRVVALADVFDALGSKRSYKEPWSNEEIKAEIAKQRGLHFEPKLVDLMLENWGEFISVRDEYPD